MIFCLNLASTAHANGEPQNFFDTSHSSLFMFFSEMNKTVLYKNSLLLSISEVQVLSMLTW